MPVHYLVDGYNLLHQNPSFKRLLGVDLETAREALLTQLLAYCAASQDKVTVVFDGRGRLEEAFTHHAGVPNLTVRYSPGRHSADTVIERIVYQSPNRMQVVVVSDDHGLRDLCRGLGAMSMTPDGFLVTTRETRTRTDGHLQHQQRKQRLGDLEDRLDQGAVDALRRMKDRLKE